MKKNKKKSSEATPDSTLQYELRKALLQIDRVDSRKKAQRKLERIANAHDPIVSPAAFAGLAASFFWSGELSASMYWCKQTISLYPMTSSALWASGMLVSIYRTLGMRKERFEVEGDRLRMMRRIALQSASIQDRIFALNELKSELIQRDRHSDAQKCQEELQDLMKDNQESSVLYC